MDKKKTTQLRDLKIKSVSVVDQGANQHAHIQLAKRAEDEPDEKPVENDKAFFERIGQAVAKMLHIPRKGDEVEKDAQTFEAIDDSRKVRDEIWRITDALQCSLFSIISDEELTGAQKAEMIATSADQAASAIKSDIAGMFNGAAVSKGSEEETGDEGAGNQPEPATPTTEPQPQDNPVEKGIAQENNQEGAGIDMKFNTENMTPEEKATLEDLQKRFGVEEPAQDKPAADEPAPAQEDVNKGISPELKSEIEELRKFRQQAEERELTEVAKKYTIIGRKPEDLIPTLKSLKAAGGNAYDVFIAGLDSAVDAVEKSGVFAEIGKSGGSAGTSGDPWEKIETLAKGFRESDPKLTYNEAIDKACMQHPELVADYENSRR